MKHKGPPRKSEEQRRDRERCDEHAFLFGPDQRCLGRVERDDWDFAISIAGGNVVEAAKSLDLHVPSGTRALWGRSEQAAIDAYRGWQKRKARTK